MFLGPFSREVIKKRLHGWCSTLATSALSSFTAITSMMAVIK